MGLCTVHHLCWYLLGVASCGLSWSQERAVSSPCLGKELAACPRCGGSTVWPLVGNDMFQFETKWCTSHIWTGMWKWFTHSLPFGSWQCTNPKNVPETRTKRSTAVEPQCWLSGRSKVRRRRWSHSLSKRATKVRLFRKDRSQELLVYCICQILIVSTTARKACFNYSDEPTGTRLGQTDLIWGVLAARVCVVLLHSQCWLDVLCWFFFAGWFWLLKL